MLVKEALVYDPTKAYCQRCSAKHEKVDLIQVLHETKDSYFGAKNHEILTCKKCKKSHNCLHEAIYWC